MKFSACKKYFFVPKINGNENLKEDEQLQIEIIRPTAGNSDELTKTKTSFDKDGKPVIETSFNTEVILKNHVGEIKNMVLEDDNGKEVKITNGEELSEACFYGAKTLVSVICTEVVSDKITASEKKISK